MSKKTVLISGASIAGLTMAYWMNRNNYDVTVVELSAAPRMGGTPIDVRGDALDTAQRMGIIEALKAARLPTMGMEFLNPNGEIEATMMGDEISIRPGEDIEIRRDDLVKIIYALIPENVEFKFSNQIVSVSQNEECVSVTFKDGTKCNYDFLIGADGLHSGVRRLVFGPEEQFTNFMNFYFTIMQVDEKFGKLNTGQVYNVPNKMGTVYFYNRGFADALLAFKSSEKINYDFRDTEAQKKIVLDAFKDEEWKIPAILERIKDADNFYFDQGCQIKMPKWTNGRVALIGDAGYAPAFPTGMGITLAMQGATTLADAMADNSDYKTAFEKYNENFRPTVDSLQATVYRGISFLIPESQEAIDARNKALK
ncbi:FAD-dependent oxidoreductase [Marivirga lumbricoides]|uniref:FAD-dependent oxidoreductase n=1 Tax=Marivirga lumbricoides TaxID=1046115 RepID=A0ABQ1MCR7_9BACT|nr:FAD-dependent oxidoreductase [Marivirga lumbricoides]